MQPPPLFLTPEELRALTGRARAQDQIAVLRAQGVAFLTNASKKPVVTRAAVEGRAQAATVAPSWTPKPLRAA
jgi:hypothetical protein